jgi:hypothetical protein
MDKGYIFKAVWRGWFVGATAFFVPLFLLAAVFAPEAPQEVWLAPLMVPVITAVQGVVLGGIVVLGLSLWPLKQAK